MHNYHSITKEMALQDFAHVLGGIKVTIYVQDKLLLRKRGEYGAFFRYIGSRPGLLEGGVLLRWLEWQ